MEGFRRTGVRRKDRIGKGGGGVMIMTKKELTVKAIESGNDR